jgi:CheY-like chemotaxis protein
MPRGGTLALRTANREVDAAEAAALGLPQGGAWVTLEVRDSGCGMDAATLARIFEPFYTTKPRGVGTGLGLATVQGIVQQSGGHVTASSRPGAGSVFTVYLPKSAGVAEPLVSGGSAPGRPLAGRRVLLAEDDDAVRAPLAACLKLCGCTVVSAARGETALRALDEAEAPFDLLLTDVVMPGMSGAELAAAVVARQPQVRVLFMSGYLEETVLLRGVTSDRAAFLQKPFTLAALEQKLRTAFADAALPAG